jgi:hypothetical protein
MKTTYILFYTLLLATIVSFSSCKKPLSFSNGNLSFSADTLVFDTVFTTIGSVTKRLKIYNNSKKTLKIDQIELMGGANSVFRINVDGSPGTVFGEIEMDPEDSLFIFVEVTLDPNNQANPMVIEDQIRFLTNGVNQYVQLAAWGQDAYFHYSYISINDLDTNEGTWPNDKPHVIYGGAFIDSAKTLNILAGTKIYLHKNAILYNYKGTLNIYGAYNNEVTFQGDRLDAAYNDVSGQYYGIYFHEARPSTINYAIIKNGSSGIHVFSEDPSNSVYTVTVTNTKILNNASYGIFIYSGAKVKAENCLIAKNGIHAMICLEGGDFNLNHCTLVGYGNGDGQTPAIGIRNYFTRPDNNGIPTTFIGSINEGKIYNSVIYGNYDREYVIDTLSGATLNFDFRDNHIRSTPIPTDNFFTSNGGNTYNSDPVFKSPSIYDFSVFSTSPLIGTANPGTSLTSDIEGKARDPFSPDKGAYEF